MSMAHRMTDKHFLIWQCI